MSTLNATMVQVLQPNGWAELPFDLLNQIAGLVLEEDLTYYVWLRGVCSSWRCGTRAPNDLESRFRPKNWVLMMEGEAKIATYENEKHCYLNIRTGKGLKTNNILDLVQEYTILSVVDGSLVLMHNKTTKVCLLNPLTRSFTDELPPLSTVVPMIPARDDEVDVNYVRRLLLSVQFASSTVVINFRDIPLVVYAKAGDRRWSRIRERGMELSSMASFQEELYGVSTIGEVFKFVPSSNARFPAMLVHIVSVLDGERYPYYILVESDRKLLLVSTTIAVQIHPYIGVYYLFAEVYEVKLQNSQLIPVANLGDNSLFLSCNKAVSLSCSVFPSLDNNSMCFIRSRQIDQFPFSIFYTMGLFPLAPNRFPMQRISGERVIRPFSIVDHMIFYCKGF